MATYNQRNTNRVNMEALGRELRKHLAERAALQEQQDRLWEVIKRGNNRSSQMRVITDKIGKNTYAIDRLISQLAKSGVRSGQVSRMAIGYLKSEIARNQRIVSGWEKTIREVERGRSHLIRSNGVEHRDTTNVRNYVAQKKRKIAEAQRYLNTLTRCA